MGPAMWVRVQGRGADEQVVITHVGTDGHRLWQVEAGAAGTIKMSSDTTGVRGHGFELVAQRRVRLAPGRAAAGPPG